MKNACIYLLLTLFLLNGSLSELSKLPVLFSHFSEHKTANPDIDLLDFVAMHYFGHDHNNQDNERDMELPFKKMECQTSFQLAITTFQAPCMEVKRSFPPEKKSPMISDAAGLPDRSPRGVFRPPIA